MLAAEYPKWQTVYYYFRRWGAMDAFSELEDILVATTTPANIHDSKSAYAFVAMLVTAYHWIKRIYADRGIAENSLRKRSMISVLI